MCMLVYFAYMIVSFLQRCTKRGVEHDAPVARYYERLATVQARGSQASHQVLRDILKDVQSNMVPRGLLKEWAVHTFQTATDYWTFRKTVSSYYRCRFLAHLS
jgi:transformation/transcription domain-associated protein